MKIQRVLLLVGAVGAMGICGRVEVQAAAQMRFSVVPLQIEFPLAGGQIGTATITLRNPGDQPISLEVYIKDFRREADGSETELTPGVVSRSCSAWLSISPTTVDLGPKETRPVRVSLTVPPGSKGSYWSKIYVEEISKPEPIEKKNGQYSMRVFFKQRWEIRVLTNIPQTAERSGQITDMRMIPQNEAKPLQVEVAFENTGNTLLRCSGRIEIRNDEGNTIETMLIGDKGLFGVYPDSKRVVSGSPSTPLSPGNYTALAIVDYGGEELVSGELEFEVK